jgi:hypothetical protein
MPADFFSIADALVVIVLLVPGFVAAKIFARITAFDRKLSDFEMTVLSFALSLVTYIPFSYLTSIDTLNKIRQAALMPQNITLLLLLAVVIGLLPGLMVKRLYRRGYHPGTVWDAVIRDLNPKESVFVLVYTALGQEIMGQLDQVGTGDTAKELRLLQPKMIIRDKNYEATNRLQLGKQMFIAEKDIQSIAFL